MLFQDVYSEHSQLLKLRFRRDTVASTLHVRFQRASW